MLWELVYICIVLDRLLEPHEALFKITYLRFWLDVAIARGHVIYPCVNATRGPFG